MFSMTTGWQNWRPLKALRHTKRGREKSSRPCKAGVILFASSERTLTNIHHQAPLEGPIIFPDSSGLSYKQYVCRGRKGRLCPIEDAGRFPGRILRMRWGWLADSLPAKRVQCEYSLAPRSMTRPRNFSGERTIDQSQLQYTMERVFSQEPVF